ncbi:phage holin [Jeotgalibaca porci]|uniref:phage holin n=1 Tax=Jeotgalibaca porci TaxID=1868793 RepID=UPI0035A121C3
MLQKRLDNNTYDVLKWIVQIVMPALIALIGVVGATLAWEHTEIAMTLIGAVTTFLGVILGVSNSNYKKDVK